MSDADERDNKTLRMQQNWRAGPKYRSILSLVLLKEKRTKKWHKLFGKYDHIINHSIKDVISSFVFTSVIHYTSLHNTGKTVGTLSRTASSLGILQFCRARVLWSKLGGPGSKTHILAAPQKQNWEPRSPEPAHCACWGTEWSIIALAYFPTVSLIGESNVQ